MSLEPNHKHCIAEMKFMKDNVLLGTTGDLIKDPKLLCSSVFLESDKRLWINTSH